MSLKTPTTVVVEPIETEDLAERILEEINNDIPIWRSHLTVAILGIASTIMGAIATSQVFILAVPQHRCAIPANTGFGNSSTNNLFYNSLTEAQLNQTIPFEQSELAYDGADERSQCYIYKYIPHNGKPVIIGGGNSQNVTSTVEECSSWVYDYSVYPETLISELNLVCSGRAYMTKAPEMMFFLGIMLGSAVFGYVADAFGRRTALIAATMLHVLSGAGVSAYWHSDDGLYYVYCILNMLHGLLGTGVYQTGFVLAVEVVQKKHRILGGAVFAIAWTVGEAAGGALAMAKLPWRIYNLIIFAPLFVLIPLMFVFVSESVRWLVNNNKTDRLLQNVQRMSGGQTKYDQVWLRGVQQAMSDARVTVEANEESSSEPSIIAGSSKEIMPRAKPISTLSEIRELMFHATVRKNLLISSYAWLVWALVYYGLSLDMVILGGSPYINSILVSLIEIPGCFAVLFCIDRYGRKKIYVFSYVMCAATLGALGFVPFTPNMQWLIIVLALSGKCAVSISSFESYIYAAELVPTNVRTVSLGICGFTAHIGGIIAPAIALLATFERSLPFWTYAASAALAAVLTCWLPETRGKPLPATFQDMKQSVRKSNKSSESSEETTYKR